MARNCNKVINIVHNLVEKTTFLCFHNFTNLIYAWNYWVPKWKIAKLFCGLFCQFLQNSFEKAKFLNHFCKKWRNNPQNSLAIFHFCIQFALIQRKVVTETTVQGLLKDLKPCTCWAKPKELSMPFNKLPWHFECPAEYKWIFMGSLCLFQ